MRGNDQNDTSLNGGTKPDPQDSRSDQKPQFPHDIDHVQDFQTTTGHSLAHALVTRCRTLLSELDAFTALLAETQRNPQVVEVRSLRSNVLSELKTLERLQGQLDAGRAQCQDGLGNSNSDEHAQAEDGDSVAEPTDADSRAIHALRSSNLPFYEAVWTIAKRSCTGLVAFGKRFYWDGEGPSASGKGGKSRKGKDKNKRSVFVDIVADDGEEWVKVSTISETRLLFEMAKKGWEGDSDVDSDAEERTVLQNHDTGDDSDDDDDEIELLKLAGDMRKAANLVWVNYRRPKLRFVIPKVEEGSSPEIDDLLKAIRSYGVVVSCGEDAFAPQLYIKASSNDTAVQDGVGSVKDEVRNLLPNRFKRFTPTLNVDCTLLLAIVSDLSHCKDIAPSLQHHKAINRQIEMERERPLLLAELWPAMESHELICTSEAARRMREIVETIGTETERKRMTILMGDQPFTCAKSASLVEELQKVSDYPVPSQLNLPIRIIDASPAIDLGKSKLSPIARKVEEILSDINTSVFMYGWVSDIMTITSNRTVVKQVETMIEEYRNDEDLKGPLIWVCDTARSLIGKEKGRKN
ncbi:uncharacterized protein DSM5745_10117 [Aspergillus mulundensis]|uniref:DUF1308 domain-containing protein n=1 Tax=Aspergillus mulundensis TaxID=1810919 RepID=A0A3D8QME1_9EURO|nr:Uncharacterized protein DSM5745_10117 [Aspergillus mulundensis]RDW63006.1 Uncharacterized protein DSM5745_10117 [Aspergillus mulundensis]